MTKRQKLILGILLFNAITAVFGAVQLTTGWLAPPDSWLAGTVFSSYVIPGLILGVAVGGSAALAGWSLATKQRSAPLVALGSGIITIGWICGEIAVVQHFSWLQLLYILLGGTLIALTYTDSKRYFLDKGTTGAPHDLSRPIYH